VRYSLVGSQTHARRWLSAIYRHFQVTSSQMTSLPGHFWSAEVLWHHFLSCDWILLRATAFFAIFRPSKTTSRRLPVKWRHFRVTEGHLRSRDVSCHVTATSCKLQLCGCSIVPKTRVSGHLQKVTGDFHWNDATSGSLPFTWGPVTWYSVSWLPPPVSCSPVVSQTFTKFEFLALYSYFHVTSGQMTSLLGNFRSREVTWRHFLSRDCLLLRVTTLLVLKRNKNPSLRHSTALPRGFWWNDINFGSLAVTWDNVMSFSMT